jgi:4-amino-4-deoxy-L-arabinose transferase-like glycosyltransferase
MVLISAFVLLPLVLRTRSVDLRRRLQWLVAGGLCAALVVAPWIGFNRNRFNEPVYLSTNFGRTAAAANCHETYYGDRIGFKSYACLTKTSRQHVTPAMDDSQSDKELRHYARKYISSHLSWFPVVVLARWGRILEVYRPFQEIKLNAFDHTQGSVVARLVIWTFWLGELLALAGAVALRRRMPRVPLYPLLAFPAVVMIAVAITFAEQRYRALAQPSVVILAAVAIDGLVRRIRRRGTVSEPALATAPAEPAASRPA